MPPVVSSLQQSCAYIFCPTCRAQGTDNSMLSRDQTNKFSCRFGHAFPTWDALQAMNPKMVPMSDFQQESINPEAMKYSFFVMPKTMERLRARYPNNLQTTVATLLDMLSDDSVLILQGSEVSELRKKGMQVKSGVEIIRALEGMKQMEKERDDAVAQLEKIMNQLKQAGVVE